MAFTPEQLSDRQELADLVSAYCRAVDENRPKDVVALFSDDCHLDYGGVGAVDGLEMAEKFFAVGTNKFYKRSAHFVSNIEINFTGPDSAAGSTYVSAWHEFHDDKPNAWIGGRYNDDFVRTDAGWKIKSRTFRALGHEAWQGDLAYIDRVEDSRTS